MSVSLILLEPVNNLGRPGEIVQVKPGYARNFLIPRGLALPATQANLKTLEARVRARARQSEREKEEALALQGRLADTTITVAVRAGEGKIYGAVTAADIAEAALAQTGEQLDRRRILLHRAIKELGFYTLTYRAHHEVSIELKVSVVAR